MKNIKKIISVLTFCTLTHNSWLQIVKEPLSQRDLINNEKFSVWDDDHSKNEVTDNDSERNKYREYNLDHNLETLGVLEKPLGIRTAGVKLTGTTKERSVCLSKICPIVHENSFKSNVKEFQNNINTNKKKRNEIPEGKEKQWESNGVPSSAMFNGGRNTRQKSHFRFRGKHRKLKRRKNNFSYHQYPHSCLISPSQSSANLNSEKSRNDDRSIRGPKEKLQADTELIFESEKKSPHINNDDNFRSLLAERNESLSIPCNHRAEVYINDGAERDLKIQSNFSFSSHSPIQKLKEGNDLSGIGYSEYNDKEIDDWNVGISEYDENKVTRVFRTTQSVPHDDSRWRNKKSGSNTRNYKVDSGILGNRNDCDKKNTMGKGDTNLLNNADEDYYNYVGYDNTDYPQVQNEYGEIIEKGTVNDATQFLDSEAYSNPSPKLSTMKQSGPNFRKNRKWKGNYTTPKKDNVSSLAPNIQKKIKLWSGFRNRGMHRFFKGLLKHKGNSTSLSKQGHKGSQQSSIAYYPTAETPLGSIQKVYQYHKIQNYSNQRKSRPNFSSKSKHLVKRNIFIYLPSSSTSFNLVSRNEPHPHLTEDKKTNAKTISDKIKKRFEPTSLSNEQRSQSVVDSNSDNEGFKFNNYTTNIMSALLNRLFQNLERKKRKIRKEKCALKNGILRKSPEIYKHPRRSVPDKARELEDYNSRLQSLQKELLELQKALSAPKTLSVQASKNEEKNLTLQIRVIVDVVNSTMEQNDISDDEPVKKRETSIVKKKNSTCYDEIPIPLDHDSPLTEPIMKKVLRSKRVDNPLTSNGKGSEQFTNRDRSEHIVKNITYLLDTLLENYKIYEKNLIAKNSETKLKEKKFKRNFRSKTPCFIFHTWKPIHQGESNFSELIDMEFSSATTERTLLYNLVTLSKEACKDHFNDAEPETENSMDEQSTQINKSYLLNEYNNNNQDVPMVNRILSKPNFQTILDFANEMSGHHLKKKSTEETFQYKPLNQTMCNVDNKLFVNKMLYPASGALNDEIWILNELLKKKSKKSPNTNETNIRFLKNKSNLMTDFTHFPNDKIHSNVYRAKIIKKEIENVSMHKSIKDLIKNYLNYSFLKNGTFKMDKHFTKSTNYTLRTTCGPSTKPTPKRPTTGPYNLTVDWCCLIKTETNHAASSTTSQALITITSDTNTTSVETSTESTESTSPEETLSHTDISTTHQGKSFLEKARTRGYHLHHHNKNYSLLKEYKPKIISATTSETHFKTEVCTSEQN